MLVLSSCEGGEAEGLGVVMFILGGEAEGLGGSKGRVHFLEGLRDLREGRDFLEEGLDLVEEGLRDLEEGGD